MMVVAKKMEVFSCNLNFSAHSIEVVIVLTILKLLTPNFAQMQHLGQVFLAFTSGLLLLGNNALWDPVFLGNLGVLNNFGL
jgi:hypothetical protein